MAQVKVYAGEDTLAKWHRICEGFTSNTAAFVALVENYYCLHQMEETTMKFTIDGEKLAEVTRIFNEETDASTTEQALRDSICYDWPEGEEHQQWISEAGAQEIADWLASFHEAE